MNNYPDGAIDDNSAPYNEKKKEFNYTPQVCPECGGNIIDDVCESCWYVEF